MFLKQNSLNSPPPTPHPPPSKKGKEKTCIILTYGLVSGCMVCQVIMYGTLYICRVCSLVVRIITCLRGYIVRCLEPVHHTENLYCAYHYHYYLLFLLLLLTLIVFIIITIIIFTESCFNITLFRFTSWKVLVLRPAEVSLDLHPHSHEAVATGHDSQSGLRGGDGGEHEGGGGGGAEGAESLLELLALSLAPETSHPG